MPTVNLAGNAGDDGTEEPTRTAETSAETSEAEEIVGASDAALAGAATHIACMAASRHGASQLIIEWRSE
jgi:hypothetical protein